MNDHQRGLPTFCDSCGFEYTEAEPYRTFDFEHLAYYSAKLNAETRARLDAGVPLR